MFSNLKPIPRHLLARFLSDPETIKAFEKLSENAGVLIPDEVVAIGFAANSAVARAEAAEGLLSVLESAFALLAMAPVPLPPGGQGEFAPAVAHEDQLVPFELPHIDADTLPYGAMYSNTPTVVAVAAANVAYEITAGVSTGLVHLMTFGGAHYLQADRGGIYEINWSVSVHVANPNEQLEGGIMINGVAQTEGLAHGDTQGATFDIEISGSAILRVSALQQLSLYVENHTAANNITVDHLSFTAKLIDRRVVT